MRVAVCVVIAAIGLAAQPASAQADRKAAAFWRTVQATCNATAARPPSELGRRVAQVAIDEFTRFDGHKIDSTGRLFHFGLTEAEHDEDDGGNRAASVGHLGWWQVMKYWRVLYGTDIADVATKLEVRGYSDASTLTDETKAAALLRSSAARLLSLAESVTDPVDREILREAALRAAVVDTPWSAAFISYVVRQAGAASDAFRYANAHRIYIYDAFEASVAEPIQKAGNRLYRACPLTTTKARVGDLLCQQREPGLADATDKAVRERIWGELNGGTDARSVRRTHCEVVAYVDRRAHKLYTIGGNVNQSVTARKLNLRRSLRLTSNQHSRCGGPRQWTLPRPATATAPEPDQKCSLNDKNWFVLLQMR